MPSTVFLSNYLEGAVHTVKTASMFNFFSTWVTYWPSSMLQILIKAPVDFRSLARLGLEVWP